MSYHISFSLGTPNKQLDINSGIETDRVDHITWHKKVINLKAGTKKIEQIFMPSGNLFYQEFIL